MAPDVVREIVEFLERFAKALGITATVTVEETADGPRINLGGDEVEISRHAN